MKFIPAFLLFLGPILMFAQSNLNDKEAGALLQASSAKYKSSASLSADFTLTIIRPRPKPTDDEKKFTEIQKGKVWVQGSKFKIALAGNEISCDGENIWTYIAKSKECQLNEYVESDEIFSPGKIFNLFQSGYAYQVKEKKELNGQQIVIIEMAPSNRKVSFFKIDVGLDEKTKEILEVKVYEKNGTRYIYTLNKVVMGSLLGENVFSFDNKKFPGVKIVDLR